MKDLFDRAFIVCDEASIRYAKQVLDEAANQTEICCNNFHPTITRENILNLKDQLK